MRISHFERFAPRCPICVNQARQSDLTNAVSFDPARLPRLVLHEVYHAETTLDLHEIIVHGVLRCAEQSCQAEFPIIDGIPIVLANARETIAFSAGAIFKRADLPEPIEAMLGDCLGSSTGLANGGGSVVGGGSGGGGAWFDRARLYAGAYASDHYGMQIDHAEASSKSQSNAQWNAQSNGYTSTLKSSTSYGAAARIMERLVHMAGGFGGRLVHGQAVGADTRSFAIDVIDIGCATGGVCLRLAELLGDDLSATAKQRNADALVLGIDINIGMLRIAQWVIRTGLAKYPLRREGLVYDHQEVQISPMARAHAHRVDFWCCDALALPIASRSVAACVALNTLDSVASPVGLLAELARVTQTKGRVLLASPFDWNASVTPVENWLGGHSQRAEHAGESARVLAMLLSNGDDSTRGVGVLAQLRVLARDDMDWAVRLHARATTIYKTHLLACEVE